MDMRPYITSAIASFPKVLAADVVLPACSQLAISPAQFCDYFAKEVTREYLAEELSWLDANAAMNALSGFFFAEVSPIPDYAFGVFLAFDAGETQAEPEQITKEQLASLHEKA